MINKLQNAIQSHQLDARHAINEVLMSEMTVAQIQQGCPVWDTPDRVFGIPIELDEKLPAGCVVLKDTVNNDFVILDLRESNKPLRLSGISGLYMGVNHENS